MRSTQLLSLTLATLVISSCATTTMDNGKEQVQEVLKKEMPTPETWASKFETYEDKSVDWLKSFNDPLMLKLIEEGKTNNLNLQNTSNNMDKALLLAQQAGASLKPSADLSIGRSQSGQANSGNSQGSVNVGLTASWELDLWGRLGAGVDAATANAQAAEADYVFALHSLSANIAKSYLKVIEAKQQANITRENQSILEETMRITQVKFDNGLSSGQDVAVNRSNLASAKEQLIQLEASERDALRALELLLGRYPDASIDIPTQLPDLPAAPPAGIPSEILERRPDLVSAERKIAAAFNASKQAKAARLPRLSLTTNITGSSTELSDVLNPSNVVWQLASNLMLPLIDGGRLKSEVEIKNIEQQQAVTSYVNTALTAFSEVESTLDQGSVLALRKTALDEVVVQSQKAYDIAKLRYQEGEIGLLDTLSIQRQSISAQSNTLSIERAQLEQRINLYLAIGGNW